MQLGIHVPAVITFSYSQCYHVYVMPALTFAADKSCSYFYYKLLLSFRFNILYVPVS